jgi:DNA-binding transcriptional ArsR family regulator
MDLADALSKFAALAQENRLQSLRMLVQAGPRGMPAGGLSEALALPAPTMSFHLKELARAGLIRATRQGRHIYYAADYGGIRRLIDFLLADCCQGDPRLCGPYIIKENSREPFACAPQS